MIPLSDDHLARVVAEATRRVGRAASSGSFDAGVAERIVFDVGGHAVDASSFLVAAGRLGESAVRDAKRRLRREFGGRAPTVGWLGFPLLAAALAGALAGAVALRPGGEGAVPWVVGLATASAASVVVTVAGSRARPIDPAISRALLFAVAGLALAAFTIAPVAGEAASGLVAAAAVLALAAFVFFVVLRRVRRQDAEVLAEAVPRAYLASIDDVERERPLLAERMAASLDPAVRDFLVRARAAVFAAPLDGVPARARDALREADASAPIGAHLIATRLDPLRWLPTPLAKTYFAVGDPRHPDTRA